MQSKYRKPYTIGVPAPYEADSGCDVNMPKGSPVLAFGDGMILYAEGWRGCGNPHTPWVPTDEHPNDTPGAILQALDKPVLWKGVSYPLAWYCHLSAGFPCLPDGTKPWPVVKAGMMIGYSGIGRSIPHLHFGLLTNRSQGLGEYMAAFEVEALLKSWF
jgi:hypothetical protein